VTTAHPRVLRVDRERLAPDDLAEAARLLVAGGLVAFPTETFYGLGASALDPGAVARVFQAKGRPDDKPLLVLVATLAMARQLARAWPPAASRLADRHWPGPLTLVVPARRDLPAALTAGTGTLGVRIPGHPVARALVRAAGIPLTAPSANRHGAPPPRTAAEVVDGLGGGVDLVVDGGPTAGGVPSTILDVTGDRPRVLRPGAVTLAPEDLAAS
jgi:L-threonylcarbamoyladenylate synthase